MNFKTLRDADVRGRRVLLREDLNVPMKNGAIADETRITAALPTLRLLHGQGAKTVILSHLGRPDGQRNPKYSLRPLAPRLSELLGTPVGFVDDCVGDACVAASRALPDGGFVLFENVRFHAEEEQNDPAFAARLAESGDLYVNDAFGTAHRAHASTAGVAADLPAYAGLLMEGELAALARLTDEPVHPFVCAIGGAKVVDKVGVFENLLGKVDAFVIGGGMANTFLAAQGIDVGASLRDPDLAPAQRIIAAARNAGVSLHLPTDAVVADAFDADATARVVALDAVGSGMILDIGPASAQAYAAVLRGAKTIVFNGPMGVYEKPPYQNGTRTIGEAIADATRHGAISVVGGGDAAAAAHALGFADAMTHVSTGGGATLEFLEGKTLPGVAALLRP
ncbi:phosphoglycerate kinase [Vulcanimicrobium alpinum]|uniref:Phosphoglycerate kinase n=1 Tax=Vulcanimicrobium alpinum TaxID=3016050 RepID=A0AAN2CB07_UNVUL|nr:phosphoglycerate kinase [Vulcanimicrobium alpinum]BDE07706.1 phosphoglycerate kinase [Vulcanimicrobium alpinum]